MTLKTIWKFGYLASLYLLINDINAVLALYDEGVTREKFGYISLVGKKV